MNTRDTYWANTRHTSTYAFAPRIPELQALNGRQFSTLPTVDLCKLSDSVGPDTLRTLQWLFETNRLDLTQCILTGKVGEKNLGKWLVHSHIPEIYVSKICASKISGATLTLSTRYKDFARMGANIHYQSCATTGRYRTITYYLRKPNTFLLINRDARGEFKNRVIGRVTRVMTYSDQYSLDLPKGTKVILFNRVYGDYLRLPKEIDGIPCFQQPHRTEPYISTNEISRRMIRFEVDVEAEGIDPESLGEDEYHNSLAYDDLKERPHIMKN